MPADPAKMYDKLSAFICRYPDCSVDNGDIVHVERKQNAFTFAYNHAGCLSCRHTSLHTSRSCMDLSDSLGILLPYLLPYAEDGQV